MEGYSLSPNSAATKSSRNSNEDEGRGNNKNGNGRNTNGSSTAANTNYSSSTPVSPRLSRLEKVGRFISRSDANLHNAKGKKLRHTSGTSEEPDDEYKLADSSAQQHQKQRQRTISSEGSASNSPSRGFISKATGYMTHLRSRITKHRDKSSRDKDSSSSPSASPSPHHKTTSSSSSSHHHPHQSFSTCCSLSRNEESTDTLIGIPGGATPSRNTQANSSDFDIGSGSPGGGGDKYSSISGSISVNVSSTNANHDLLSSSELKSISGGSEIQYKDKTCDNNQSNVNNHNNSRTSTGSISVPQTNSMPTSNIPFYTLNVHLQRGRNLVARDTCGSSDPYVKVKIGDKLHYKSKTIYRDLNPIWDESFVLPINDINQLIIFKVFDYDWGFQDDFMGMTSLDASRLPLHKSQEISLTLTENNISGESPMGEIFLTFTLVPRTIEEKEVLSHFLQPLPQSIRSALNEKLDNSVKWLSDGQGGGCRLVDSQRRLKSQIWSSVLTVLLLEAKDLSSTGEDKVLMDPYVKFRLGNQKYKSRTLTRTTHPKWLEQFDFYLYEGQPQMLEIQVYDESFSKDYIGRCAIDIGVLSKEETHHVVYPLQEGSGEILLLLTISGTSGAETISDLTSYKPSREEIATLQSRYALKRSMHSAKDVGLLTVKVYEAQGLAAADIGGKSDPFCVLELVNARLQTQTEYRTLTPVWNKIFTFAVKDITSILDVTVYDEDRHHKTEFLGKISIPLWRIKNGEKKWYVLKDRKLIHPAGGTNPQILLEMDLIWNPIRGALRVMDPPESKFIPPDQRLRREVFLLNIDRLRKIGVSIYGVMQYIQSCIEWEYPVRSMIALILYQVFIFTFQPFMIPLLLLILILKQWLIASVTGTSLVEDFEDDDTIVLDDDDEDGPSDGDEKKMSLRQKLQAVQDATQTLQNTLGDIASICESTRNTFRMVVPFISWIAIIALLIGTIVLYVIPLRYLFMVWGAWKFLRPILKPHVTPTNEVYNLLLRVPDNQQLILFKTLRPSAIAQDATVQQKNRSPPVKQPAQKKKYKFW